MNIDGLGVVSKKEMYLRKYDGEKQEGQVPTEIHYVHYDVVDGNDILVEHKVYTDPQEILEIEKKLADAESARKEEENGPNYCRS